MWLSAGENLKHPSPSKCVRQSLNQKNHQNEVTMYIVKMNEEFKHCVSVTGTAATNPLSGPSVSS